MHTSSRFLVFYGCCHGVAVGCLATCYFCLGMFYERSKLNPDFMIIDYYISIILCMCMHLFVAKPVIKMWGKETGKWFAEGS